MNLQVRGDVRRIIGVGRWGIIVHQISAIERAKQFVLQRNMTLLNPLGKGKDGQVWGRSNLTALKIHEQLESYQSEREAYNRLMLQNVTRIAGFNVPEIRDYDNDLLAFEMSIVFPPYIVDFASAR